MLEDSDVAARLPAQDLARAKSFYRDKLGLTPSEERPDIRVSYGSIPDNSEQVKPAEG